MARGALQDNTAWWAKRVPGRQLAWARYRGEVMGLSCRRLAAPLVRKQTSPRPDPRLGHHACRAALLHAPTCHARSFLTETHVNLAINGDYEIIQVPFGSKLLKIPHS